MSHAMLINIIVVAIVVLVLILLWYRGQKKIVLRTIKYLVEQAEEKFGSGTGEYKYNYVTTKIYPLLPSIIRALLTAKRLDNWIEIAVDQLEGKLDKEINKN